MTRDWKSVLRRIDAYHWEVPQDYKEGMRVPGLVFADDAMMEQIRGDQSLEQVANVAFLPGIVGASMAMPDIHWGYGFAVGGVAATRVEDGVVSPGGVGFDINCGVRLLRTDLTEADVRPRLQELVAALFSNVPSGLGSSGKIRLRQGEIDQVLSQGAAWAVKNGFGVPEDLEVTEEGGCLRGADPNRVGPRPKQRGAPQLGTLGSGNHFLEVQAVDEVFDHEAAEGMGISRVGQVTVLTHCGSRGLGHQVCDDYLKVMDGAVKRYGISLPDRQLACCPVGSPEGQDYMAAMNAAANFAWANRQCIAHWIRESFAQVFERKWEDLGIRQVYDVCHNIAKIEEHLVDGRIERVCVHRKGAIRAFPPGHRDIPERYRTIGQPVLIPGDMGRYSFLAVGTQAAMEESFGSTCHGAGRTASRSAAKRMLKGRDIEGELAERGIVVKAHGWASLAEEASIAYKDVADVVEVCHQVGLSRKVARMRPLGVIKG
ncbi:MAG: RtcB family protein [Chloroflexi bacterium]|nr:RtcB family protein [Chloroflexota bacterium]